MPALPPEQLVAAITNAITESGYSGQIVSPIRRNPRRFIITGSNAPLAVTAYAWTLTFGGRQNLTMRMSMRRFTRLTNGFSKKIQNHEASVALHFMYYIHQTLRVTPAMAAGIDGHLWSFEDIAVLATGPRRAALAA
jgi:hypothetical protein